MLIVIKKGGGIRPYEALATLKFLRRQESHLRRCYILFRSVSEIDNTTNGFLP